MSLSSIMSGSDPAPAPPAPSFPVSTPQPPRPYVSHPGIKEEHTASFQTPIDARVLPLSRSPERAVVNGTSESLHPIAGNVIEVDPKEVDAEYAKIENVDMSDLEFPGAETFYEQYRQRRKRKAVEVDEAEAMKRKVIAQAELQ